MTRLRQLDRCWTPPTRHAQKQHRQHRHQQQLRCQQKCRIYPGIPADSSLCTNAGQLRCSPKSHTREYDRWNSQGVAAPSAAMLPWPARRRTQSRGSFDCPLTYTPHHRRCSVLPQSSWFYCSVVQLSLSMGLAVSNQHIAPCLRPHPRSTW